MLAGAFVQQHLVASFPAINLDAAWVNCPSVLSPICPDQQWTDALIALHLKPVMRSMDWQKSYRVALLCVKWPKSSLWGGGGYVTGW